MILKKTSWLLMVISLILLISTTVAAQVADGGYQIFKPDAPGPHPAVIFVSGCSGVSPPFAPNALKQPAEKLRKIGFVVVLADYLGQRKMNTCSELGAAQISQADVGRDVVAAATWLCSQPYVDAKRITAIGWSYGGGVVLAAMGTHNADKLIFTRAIVYYPSCADRVKPWSNLIPVLVLRGGSDNVATYELCESALGTNSGKANVKIIVYPDAQHCFDYSELPPKLEFIFGTFGYHPQAAAAAWDEVIKFLQSGK